MSGANTGSAGVDPPKMEAPGANTWSAGVGDVQAMNINEGSAGSGGKKDRRDPRPIKPKREDSK